jgi:hypothetical protein
MAEPPHPADGSSRYEEEPRSGVPRWVRILAIVLAVLALLVVVGLLIGGGHQGPSRHF